jgi:hypothetical protein
VCVSERGVLSTPPRTPTSRRCSERSGGVELEARGPLQTEQAVARGELARLRDEAAALRASMAREQTELQQDSAAVRAAVSREQAQLDAARSAHHTQLAAVHAAQVATDAAAAQLLKQKSSLERREAAVAEERARVEAATADAAKTAATEKKKVTLWTLPCVFLPQRALLPHTARNTAAPHAPPAVV